MNWQLASALVLVAWLSTPQVAALPGGCVASPVGCVAPGAEAPGSSVPLAVAHGCVPTPLGCIPVPPCCIVEELVAIADDLGQHWSIVIHLPG